MLWQAGILIGLGVFGLSNLAALVFGRPNADRTRRAIPWLQRSTSLQLAVIAWLWVGLNPFSVVGWLIALGMSVSFIADLIMAQVIRLPNHVLGGMAVFGGAHLLYIGAFWSSGLLRGEMVITATGILAAIGVIIWQRWVRTPAMPALMNHAALIYMLLLTTMAGHALALAAADPGLWMVGAGALLFVLSDSILGNQIFRQHHWRYVSEWVWLTYIFGQAGIVWGNWAWQG